MSKLELAICTPEKVALEATVDSVVVPGTEGELGILPDHTSLISMVKFGILRFRQGDRQEQMIVGDGFLEVNENKVSVLVRSAEKQGDIDLDRAKKALERARSRINSMGKDIDFARAELALARAILRLDFQKRI